jgi:hypothetical protein
MSDTYECLLNIAYPVNDEQGRFFPSRYCAAEDKKCDGDLNKRPDWCPLEEVVDGEKLHREATKRLGW